MDIQVQPLNIVDSSIRISETFYSIQGETTFAGRPTFFIRLTGCPLRCLYCDTEYAFKGGKNYQVTDLVKESLSYSSPYVTITGGEPLAQRGVYPLLSALCDQNKVVSLETSGALCIRHVDPRIHIIMDLKTPSSAESDKNYLDNIGRLKKSDQVKFVIKDRYDFDWTLDLVQSHAIEQQVSEILVSPWHDQLNPAELAEWVLAESIPMRLQVQLHKYLWPNQEMGY